jgi:hypothetical protein
MWVALAGVFVLSFHDLMHSSILVAMDAIQSTTTEARNNEYKS